MKHYYFAYGSNMNPANVKSRGLVFNSLQWGRMRGVKLAFNKLACDRPSCSYANVVYAKNSYVEGVLYQLVDENQIAKLDDYETTPRFYSRDYFPIEVSDGSARTAWVYIANRAVIVEGLLPEVSYMTHLLAAEAYLSHGYFQMLMNQPVKSAE